MFGLVLTQKPAVDRVFQPPREAAAKRAAPIVGEGLPIAEGEQGKKGALRLEFKERLVGGEAAEVVPQDGALADRVDPRLSQGLVGERGTVARGEDWLMRGAAQGGVDEQKARRVFGQVAVFQGGGGSRRGGTQDNIHRHGGE